MDGVSDSTRAEYITGTCMAMCPRKEIKLRERENLLHIFEVKDGTENNKPRKADPEKVVKSYSRSGAGHIIEPSELRPYPVLQKTVRYLFHNIFPKHTENAAVVYDFMFDRLRSVRQDMVIQNLSPQQTIDILEPIARFHMFFGYILSGESGLGFDPFINNTHLQECLKRLLVCYDESGSKESLENDMAKLSTVGAHRNRCDIEAAYLLLNTPHIDALTRGAKMAGLFLDREHLTLSFNFYLRNYIRVLHSLQNLPPLLLCVASQHIPAIRKFSLQALSHAFSSSNCSYPLSHLKELLLYENNLQLLDDCSRCNIKVDGDKVKFLKKDFNQSAELLKPSRSQWIDKELLKCNLIQLLYYGC